MIDITLDFTYLSRSISPPYFFFPFPLFLHQLVFSTCFQEKHLSEIIRSEAQVGLLVCRTPPQTVTLLPRVCRFAFCHVIVGLCLSQLCPCSDKHCNNITTLVSITSCPYPPTEQTCFKYPVNNS